MGQKLREEIGSFNYDNLIPDTSFPVQVGVVSVANGQGTLLRGTVLGANATGHYVVADTTESVLGSVILTDTLETKALEEGSDGYKELKNAYDAADKAYTYIRQNMHDLMGDTIKKVQGYLDVTNVAVTDNGTRMSRLDLISNRLMEQQTTFRTLQSENEDVDIADVAINLSSAELTYNSSLMATSKIMQTTLMNYI